MEWESEEKCLRVNLQCYCFDIAKQKELTKEANEKVDELRQENEKIQS